MSTSATPVWAVASTPIDDRDARYLLRLYFTEMASRYFGRVATDEEIDAAMLEDPSADLVPPDGLFLLARRAGDPAGCVGLRRLSTEIAEITRMFIRANARRHGGGSALLTAVESGARQLGASIVRLDTRHDLVEARNLYAKHGYVEIPAYSQGPYADHWFEKRLT
ncbi:MAG: GNAT family N-acetyltransferase [Pseudonocardiaceae bacterium]